MAALCRYSTLFGAPGRGAHSLRIGGLAAVDLLATAGLAWVLARRALGASSLVVLVLVFVALVLASVLVHAAFCVDTRLTAAVFGRPWAPGGGPGCGPGRGAPEKRAPAPEGGLEGPV